jgi:CheY-like chemotaxis protein
MISKEEILQARILVVDDDHTNVRMFELALAGIGYHNVTGVTNPELVSALHAENPFDLILMDLYMPKMDGFAVMAELTSAERYGYLPVLMITGDPSQKLPALEAGAKDFLSKPFDVAELRARVHNMIEVRLLYKGLRDVDRALEDLE